MPRRARRAPGGLIYHVLNRGVGRMRLFRHDRDYLAFLRCFRDTLDLSPIDVLAYCLMPNHWHLVLAPSADGQISRFMQRLTITHVRRWLEHRRAVGSGHVYQGRFKSFVCQDDAHLLMLCRYVERNPLRARMVERAEDWTFSSLRRRSDAAAGAVATAEADAGSGGDEDGVRGDAPGVAKAGAGIKRAGKRGHHSFPAGRAGGSGARRESLRSRRCRPGRSTCRGTGWPG